MNLLLFINSCLFIYSCLLIYWLIFIYLFVRIFICANVNIYWNCPADVQIDVICIFLCVPKCMVKKPASVHRTKKSHIHGEQKLNKKQKNNNHINLNKDQAEDQLVPQSND